MAALSFTIQLLMLSQRTSSETVTCIKHQDCSCSSSIAGESCILNCNGEDQCKDSALTCRNGDDCVIICDDSNACGGDARIDGNGASSLSVSCGSDNACSGNTILDGSGTTDVSVTCVGTDSCKGNTRIICGSGSCTVECDGGTSCQDTTIDTSRSSSFECHGDCPSDIDWDSFTSSPTTDTPTVSFVQPSSPSSPSPTVSPSPSIEPTSTPTAEPTRVPTTSPSHNPSKSPTMAPSAESSTEPTPSPSTDPTLSPSIDPTMSPSMEPTTHRPTSGGDGEDGGEGDNEQIPSPSPTAEPTLEPTEGDGDITDPLTAIVTPSPLNEATDTNSEGAAEEDIKSTVPMLHEHDASAEVFYGMSIGDLLMLSLGVVAVFCLCAIGVFARRRSSKKQWAHCTSNDENKSPKSPRRKSRNSRNDRRRITATDAVSSDSESGDILDRRATNGLQDDGELIAQEDGRLDDQQNVHRDHGVMMDGDRDVHGNVGGDQMVIKVDPAISEHGLHGLHKFGAGLSAKRMALSKEQSSGSSLFGRGASRDPVVRGSDAMMLPAYKQTAGMIQAFLEKQESMGSVDGVQETMAMKMGKSRDSVELKDEQVLSVVVESDREQSEDSKHHVGTQGFIGGALNEHRREDLV